MKEYCVSGVDIKLTQNTHNTQSFSNQRGMYSTCTGRCIIHTQNTIHTARYNGSRRRYSMCCATGICIILTRSTLHTDGYIDQKRVQHARCSIYTWGVLCVPGEFIIMTQSTPHTARYINTLGMHTMWTRGIHHTQTAKHRNNEHRGKHTLSIHHTNLQYAAHR